jgi:membrane protein YqaA with SNARE-associated domain
MAGLLAARKYLGLTPATEAKLQTLNQRYGAWALLLAWMPVIGDPLTVLAGAARTRWWVFALLVFGGRIVRYLIILTLFEASSPA